MWDEGGLTSPYMAWVALMHPSGKECTLSSCCPFSLGPGMNTQEADLSIRHSLEPSLAEPSLDQTGRCTSSWINACCQLVTLGAICYTAIPHWYMSTYNFVPTSEDSQEIGILSSTLHIAKPGLERLKLFVRGHTVHKQIVLVRREKVWNVRHMSKALCSWRRHVKWRRAGDPPHHILQRAALKGKSNLKVKGRDSDPFIVLIWRIIICWLCKSLCLECGSQCHGQGPPLLQGSARKYGRVHGRPSSLPRGALSEWGCSSEGGRQAVR